MHDIPENKIDLTLRDRLLIGEFLRRYHARLAHEIAFNGVPSVKGSTVKLADSPEKSFNDLCGFIARSHNMSLRKAVDSIEAQKKRVHLNTHVPFVMVLLRVADYIQIHASRAPSKLLEIKTLVSPFSTGEWKKHDAIIEVNQAHDDPESIYVDAEPEDAVVLESLIKLFSGFQEELDISWSVLGEVYGRVGTLDGLGITIRRIRSSLDNLDDFVLQKKPNYIPKVLKFKTADSEMMELLIKPLYGNAPSIGVRELIQNSVDACLELKDLVKKNKVEGFEWTKGVSITHFQDENKLVIEDYGIGMTLDTVQNYFLNIGASFRNSDGWKERHHTEGKSDVNRTGRFGIGLLAAFLLGEEMLVETRHYSKKENEGLKFKCVKGGGSITVQNCKMHVGTRITIQIQENSLNLSECDWFCLAEPPVIRKVLNKKAKELTLEQGRNVPSALSELNETSWQRIQAEGFQDVMWTYDTLKSEKGVIICNGIYVRRNYGDDYYESSFSPRISEKLDIIGAKTPSIAVFDPDGRFPLDLQRTDLLKETLPFAEPLERSIANYVGGKILSSCSKLDRNLSTLKSNVDSYFNIDFDGERWLRFDISKVALIDKKLVPLDFDLLLRSRVDTLYFDALNRTTEASALASTEFIAKCKSYIATEINESNKWDKSHWIRRLFEKSNYEKGIFEKLPIIGARIMIRLADIRSISGKGHVPITFMKTLKTEWTDEKWVLLSWGVVPSVEFNMPKLAKELTESIAFGFIVNYLDWDKVEENTPSSFSEAWLELNNGSPFFEG